MKKLFLSLLLFATLIQYAFSYCIIDPSIKGPKFTITIEIGRKPDCRLAIAICKISGSGETLVGSLQSNSGSGGGGGGTWILGIPRVNLETYYPSLLSSFDGKNTIVFEESYVLPSDLSNQLGAKGDLMIRANTPYPLRYDNGEFLITFPL